MTTGPMGAIFVGNYVLAFFDISLAVVRVGGGLLVAATAWRLLAAEGEAVLSSVGWYPFEGRGIRSFERVEGDYSSILGLPLLPLIAALRRHAPDALKGFT